MQLSQLNDMAALAAHYINTTDRHVFLTGKAGTGKTTFLRHIVGNTFKNTAVAAPTGIAAINAGGVTLHSLLQLPFGAFCPGPLPDGLAIPPEFNTPDSMKRHIRFNTRKLQMLRSLELLIIDEVSMLRADLLDCIDLVLQRARRRAQPFGGLQLFFIGDLMQLPPVVKEHEWNVLRHHYRSAYFFEAKALQQHQLLTVELKHIYRQSDQVFIDLLNRLRHNEQTQDDLAMLNEFYRPGIEEHAPEGFIHLTTHNRKADKINEKRLDELEGKSFVYKAIVRDDFPDKLYPIPMELHLKKEAQVMFIKNDPTGEKRFFNGKIGKVSHLERDEIWVEFEDGEEIKVPTYDWENKRYQLDKATKEVQENVIGTFEHYPIKLAWAVTIHKSQGLTFEKAILDMAGTFAAGQLYVALSRLTSLKGLRLSSLLPTNPPGIDEVLKAFVEGFPNISLLENQLNDNRRNFLMKLAKQAFSFHPLVVAVSDHEATFNKQENRSLKQQFLKWTRKLFEETEALDPVGKKFISRVYRMLFEEEDMELLAERVAKAQTYFEPILLDIALRIKTTSRGLGSKKQVKTYREELQELEDRFVEQARQISRFAVLVAASQKGTVPAKEAFHGFEKKLETALKPPPKPNTKDITLGYFQKGMSPEKIAEERDLTLSTIMSHLAWHVGEGTLNVHKFMPKGRVKKVLKVATAEKTDSLGTIKEILGYEFEYWEIKMALAVGKRAREEDDKW
ncbi:MAG: helix-turn-helix domain-containing protein [Bacteroidota bacterium]